VRIVSLVPGSTELLFALGLGDDVVGVTHECDYPPEATDLTKVTADRITSDPDRPMTAREIDEAVRERAERGEAIYRLDVDLLRELEPDVIVTQGLCAVCAVSADDVRAAVADFDDPVNVVSLDPTTLGETMADIRTVAQATDTRDVAVELVARQRARIDRVKIAVKDAERVSVAALEWLDPVFTAGHWVPQMVELAGGFDVLGFPGERSETTTWETVAAAQPEVVVLMQCGYDVERSLAEAEQYAEQLRATGARRVVSVDANAFFSRPGPRLVDGLELLAHILHPECVRDAPAAFADVPLF
jgi:iron complex transport system substrate-binding protein